MSWFRLPSFFKRRPAAPVPDNLPLPQIVIDAIDGACILPRAPDEDGAYRTVVQFEGWGGWMYSDEGAHKALGRLFPELSDGQLAQGVRRLRIRVKARNRERDDLHAYHQAMLADQRGGIPDPYWRPGAGRKW